MTKDAFSKKIIVYDMIAFGSVIVFLWIDEFIDIPHLFFGSPATPVNITENMIETVIIAFLAIGMLGTTWTLLGKIKYLEGFLPVCAFCHKIRIGETWTPIEEYIRDHSAAEFTHGCCPICAEKHYGIILKNKAGENNSLKVALRGA